MPDANSLIGRLLTALDGDRDPNRLCAACVIILPVQHASIMLYVANAGFEVLAASSPVAARIDAAQAAAGEGPAASAVELGGPVMSPDLGHTFSRSWPLLAASIPDPGVGAAFAFPLQIGAIRLGALNLYSDAGVLLSDSEIADAIAVSRAVTSILMSTFGQMPGNVDMGAWLDQPTESRQIHQATGMVIAQLGVAAADAYLRLQGHAFSTGRRLDDVASDVVHRRIRFERNDLHDSAPGD